MKLGISFSSISILRCSFTSNISGEITEKKLKLAAPEIRDEMTQLSHDCEYEADAFALVTLIKLGWSSNQVIDLFNDLAPSTETHPSSIDRVKNLTRFSHLQL